MVNSPDFVAAATPSRGATLSTWHKRLGHTNYAYIEKLRDRIEISNKDRPFYVSCTKGKHKVHSKQPATHRSATPGERWHVDLVGGVDTAYTKRRRPNETATCAKTARQPFGDQPEKILPRPALTYFYNIEMNQVDRGDQIRATYPIQQRQQKGWKAMFYTMIGIVVVNSYLLSSYAQVPKEDKFTDHLAFRRALYQGLFEHATGAAGAAGAVEILPVAGPVNLVLPPGDTMPVVADPDTEDRAEIAAAADARIEHQRIPMKRAACVVCKKIATEKRRGQGQKKVAFQESSPNITSKRKDKHVTRVATGCASCSVTLFLTKGCWKAFHSLIN